MHQKPGNKPFKCDKCKYASNRAFDLRRHEQRHTKVKLIKDAFTCSVCSFTTKYKTNLGRHMRTHVQSAEENEDDACEEILVELIGPTESRSMEDTETDQDPNINAEVVSSNSSGTEQVYSPSKKNRMKVFVCGQCHYSCTRAFDLRRHEQSHTRAKIIEGIAYQCNKCNYTTKWKRNIKRHVAKHVQLSQQFEVANEDDLTSEEVIVDLINSDDIRTEIEIEHQPEPEPEPEQETETEPDPGSASPVVEVESSGQRLFKCAKCKYVSKRAFDLRRHERRHTKVRVLDGAVVKCPECPFVTKWKRNIRRHMEQHRRTSREENPNSTKQIFENLVQNLRWDSDAETMLIEAINSDAEEATPKEEQEEQFLDYDAVEAEEEEEGVLPSHWVALNSRRIAPLKSCTQTNEYFHQQIK